MITLTVIYVALLATIAFRILLFTRHGTHKPIIGWLAYSIMVASFIQIIAVLSGITSAPTISEVVLATALAIALLAHHGNIAHLIKADQNGPKPLRWLAYTPKTKPAAKRKRQAHNNKVNP